MGKCFFLCVLITVHMIFRDFPNLHSRYAAQDLTLGGFGGGAAYRGGTRPARLRPIKIQPHNMPAPRQLSSSVQPPRSWSGAGRRYKASACPDGRAVR